MSAVSLELLLLLSLLLLLLLLLLFTLLLLLLLFYCYTTYVTENKLINVSMYAKYDIENVVRRKGVLSIFFVYIILIVSQ